jgi:hypothetical protein
MADVMGTIADEQAALGGNLDELQTRSGAFVALLANSRRG